MPKPLLSVFPKFGRDGWDATWGSDALRAFPEHAVVVAETIAAWALVEAAMGRTLCAMLGAQAEPAMAMFNAIRSGNAQGDALLAAAKVVLPKEDAELLARAYFAIKKLGKYRHWFAHHVWGTSQEAPGALLLSEPEFHTEPETVLEKRLAGVSDEDRRAAIFFTHRLELVRVFTLADVQQGRENTLRAVELIGLLWNLVAFPPDRRDGVRLRLSTAPELQKDRTTGRNGDQPPP